MLRISKIMDYGILVLSYMADNTERLCSASELSKALSLNPPTVSKVLKLLGGQGLVKSVRGAQGGYVLSRPATQISIAQVIDALDDQPFGLTECTSLPGSCDFETGCTLRANWLRINAIVRRTLEDVSVADMARPGSVPLVAGISHAVVRRQPAV